MRPPADTIQAPVCSGCGQQKRAANKWWRVKLTDTGTLDIGPLKYPLASGDYNVCGVACAMRVISEYMDEVLART